MAHKSLKRLLACLAVLSAAPVLALTTEQPVPLDTTGCTAVKYFVPRSQGRDKVRQLVGVSNYVHIFRGDTEGWDNWYSMFSVMAEYTQSFRSHDIASALFGGDVCACGKKYGIKIQGRGIAQDPDFAACTNPDADPCFIADPFLPSKRGENAWLADYFYLPQDFESTVCFSPQIRNFLVDFDMFFGFGNCPERCLRNAYVRLYGPIVHSRWDLGMCEEVTRKGTLDHPAGYFTPDVLERSFLLSSFSAYAQGSAPGDGRIRQTWVEGAAANNGPISMDDADKLMAHQIRHWDTNFQPLRYARMATYDRKVTSFADLRLELGADFVMNEDYAFAANIQVAAPTGTRLDPCYLFSPIVGNGHHWELGGGITGHWNVWRNDEESRAITAYIDLNVTHLFRDHQRRTFELKGRPNSAYMLVQRGNGCDPRVTGSCDVVPFDNTATNISSIACKDVERDYTSVFAPLANISTLDVKVSVDVQVDLVAMLNMQLCGFDFDLGYNFWMRGCEKFHCGPCVPADRSGRNLSTSDYITETWNGIWSLKGDAAVFCYGPADASPRPTYNGANTYKQLNPYRIPVSQSNATIHDTPRGTGPMTTGGTQLVGGTRVVANSGVDNPAICSNTGNTAWMAASPGDSITRRINCSYVPVTLTLQDLDFVRTRGMSHKIFANLGYEFGCNDWNPFIGIGGFGEFGSTGSCSDNCARICDNACVKTSLSQWGIWLKGGLNFR